MSTHPPDHNSQHTACLMRVLKKLLTHTHLTANALAKKLNLPTPTVNRLLTGEVLDPRASTMIAIADFFGVTIDQLLGKSPLTGEFAEQDHTNKLITRPPLSIPTLSMTEAISYETYLQTPVDWLRWQDQEKHNESVEKNIFAVTIKNNIYDPIFIYGTRIIINPSATPTTGDYVLVSFADDTTAVIKKYISEGQYKYLYPLNTDLKTIAFDPKSCRIIGVIIEAYVSFNHN